MKDKRYLARLKLSQAEQQAYDVYRATIERAQVQYELAKVAALLLYEAETTMMANSSKVRRLR